MRRILLDSDVIIDILRNFRKTIEVVERLFEKSELYVSGITEAEVLAGEELTNENKKEIVMELLSRFEKFNPNNEALKLSGEFKRRYKISLLDCIIAATAYVIKAELFSKNLKDFEKIEEIKMFRY